MRSRPLIGPDGLSLGECPRPFRAAYDEAAKRGAHRVALMPPMPVTSLADPAEATVTVEQITLFRRQDLDGVQITEGLAGYQTWAVIWRRDEEIAELEERFQALGDELKGMEKHDVDFKSSIAQTTIARLHGLSDRLDALYDEKFPA